MSSHVRPPKIRRKGSRAVVTLSDGSRRRDYALGKFGSRESKNKYEQLLQDWNQSRRRILPNPFPGQAGLDIPLDLTVNELLEKFWNHAQDYYRRPDGTQTTDLSNIKMALRPVKHLYAHTQARLFGPIALKAVRQIMIDGYDHPKFSAQAGVARNTINKRIRRIIKVWKWGAENELVPAMCFEQLQCVEGLRKGRTKARETVKIKPVAEKVIKDTLPHLLPVVAAMVRVQLETAMRPGEVVIMRLQDLDTSGELWTYRPATHKNDWREQDRVIVIGPKAQAMLRPWLEATVGDPTEYLFQPREARQLQDRGRSEGRRTKLWPSHERVRFSRRKAKPSREPRLHYTADTYGRAIARACERAFPFPFPETVTEDNREKWAALHQEEIKAWHKKHRWHPNQLRHTKATEIRRECGRDHARAVLGDTSPAITDVYAERDARLAGEAMELLG
jgi:integrase